MLIAAAPLRAGETIYLQSGEEYPATITRIADGTLHCTIGGEERTVPLDDIQRIEFQRQRLLDDAETAADLPDNFPFFRRALEPKTKALRERFPQAGVVVIEDRTVITLGERRVWEVKRFRAWRVLQQRGTSSAMRSIQYFADRQKAEVLFGLSVLPDGRVLHLADTAMKDEALHARLPRYNFQHRLRFTLKGAAPGTTFFLATRRVGRASLLLPLVVDRALWTTEPALRRSVRLAAHMEQRARVAVATANGLEAAEHDFWEVTDAPQILSEPMMPPRRALAPRLLLVYPMGTWAEIAESALERARGAATLSSKGLPPRKLFHAVRTGIRVEDVPLSALPDGPAPPERVAERGYGNEAERALYLAALLRGSGWTAQTVLVRGRDNGPLISTLPRWHGFDHAVVHALGPDGTEYWLQADDEDRGFEELDGDVQGADGLNLHTGHVVRVPVRRPAQEQLQRTVEVALTADGSATVSDEYLLRGHWAKAHRALKSMTEAERRRWAARFVGSDVTGVDLLGFEHTDFSKANPEERVAYRYRMPGLAERSGKFLLLRLPNAEVSASEVGRSTREHPLFWERPERRGARFTVRAPQGYRVYALADGFAKKADGWSAASRFAADETEPNTVVFRDVWERSALGAPKGGYGAYREARIRRSRLRNEVIVFVKR
jgi:hypothetical protein